MKNFIKKATATAFSTIGILSTMPSAFCAPVGENNVEGNNSDRGHIDVCSAMVISKYFDSVQDVGNLEMASKRYKDLAARFHFNPVEFDSEQDFVVFPNTETYYQRNITGNGFVYKFPSNSKVRRMIYLPYSFGLAQFRNVLSANNIGYSMGACTSEDWQRIVKFNDGDPAKGCRLIFKNVHDGREIVFMFDPCINGELQDVSFYNKLMDSYNIGEDAYISLGDEFSIPDSARVLSNGAFYQFNGYFDELKKVNIPASVVSIGNTAFKNCSGLKEVNMSNSVTTIGEDAFKNCLALNRINISNSVENIGNNAFEGCAALDNVVIPASVKTIGKNIFKNCTSLKNITIPSSVTSIGDYAFKNCTSLKKVVIPDSVESIGKNAFEGCSNLTQIDIPNSVKTIGSYAFNSCDSLTGISIPTSVRNINSASFGHGSRVNTIRFNGKVYNSISEFMDAFYEFKFSRR